MSFSKILFRFEGVGRSGGGAALSDAALMRTVAGGGGEMEQSSGGAADIVRNAFNYGLGAIPY